MNEKIATSSEQQSIVSKEITQSIMSITAITKDTVAFTDTISAASEQLKSLSDLLSLRVSAFVLSN